MGTKPTQITKNRDAFFGSGKEQPPEVAELDACEDTFLCLFNIHADPVTVRYNRMSMLFVETKLMSFKYSVKVVDTLGPEDCLASSNHNVNERLCTLY